MSLNSSTTGATSRARTSYHPDHLYHLWFLRGVLACQSVVFCVVFRVPLFVFAYFFLIWTLHCLSLFYWKQLISIYLSFIVFLTFSKIPILEVGMIVYPVLSYLYQFDFIFQLLYLIAIYRCQINKNYTLLLAYYFFYMVPLKLYFMTCATSH